MVASPLILEFTNEVPRTDRKNLLVVKPRAFETFEIVQATVTKQRKPKSRT